MYECSSATHVGRVRANNEDCCEALPELGLFVVADGLGGAAAGERASWLTVSTVVEAARSAGKDLCARTIFDAIGLANKRIRYESENDIALDGMGTTVTAALLRGRAMDIVNVGDSRAYRFRKGRLKRLTTDHTWLRALAEGCGRSEEEFRNHPMRNRLTRAVGAESEIKVDTVSGDFEPGDILLLSSDGLHGFVSDERISGVLAAEGTLEEKAGKLIDEALAEGAPDNVTVVLAGHGSSE